MFKTIIQKLKALFCKEEEDYDFEVYDRLVDHPNYAGEETDEDH